MWGEFCKVYAPNAERKRKEQVIYNNTASYLNKAVQELKKMNCQCTENDYCDRCCLLDDIQSLLFDVNKEIL